MRTSQTTSREDCEPCYVRFLGHALGSQGPDATLGVYKHVETSHTAHHRPHTPPPSRISAHAGCAHCASRCTGLRPLSQGPLRATRRKGTTHSSATRRCSTAAQLDLGRGRESTGIAIELKWTSGVRGEVGGAVPGTPVRLRLTTESSNAGHCGDVACSVDQYRGTAVGKQVATQSGSGGTRSGARCDPPSGMQWGSAHSARV